MKKVKITALFLVTVMLTFQPSVRADDAVVKLGRGIVNIVTSPVEYVVQYAVLEDDHNMPVAAVGGLVYGTLFTVTRILGGAYEVLTFPIPVPENYEPLMYPPTPIEAYQESLGGRE